MARFELVEGNYREAKQRANRGGEAANPLVELAALLTRKDARKQLIEIDHREDPEDTLKWMGRLSLGLLSKKDFGFSKEVAELRTNVFLRKAAERFARAGARMVLLDMHSDSYPLAFHSVKDDAKVKQLAASCKKAGHGTLRTSIR
jgi:hypothetical protein